MPQRFTCPRGHHWELSVEGRSPEGLPWLLCPVCGSRPVPDPEATPEPTSGPPDANPALGGGYEILAELSRSGMGVVYKARKIRLNRIVALKMLVTNGPREWAYLRREAEALA